MNLDTQHLREYAPARSLFDLLVKYPQEVVPIMDFVVYDYMKTKYPDFSSHQRIQVQDLPLLSSPSVVFVCCFVLFFVFDANLSLFSLFSLFSSLVCPGAPLQPRSIDELERTQSLRYEKRAFHFVLCCSSFSLYLRLFVASWSSSTQ